MDSEQIKKIEEKMEQLKARKKAILAREREQDRKDRTRRFDPNRRDCGKVSAL